MIRGQSGSGKSALASAIRAARPAHTVAIVRQDVVRREILHVDGDPGNLAVDLIGQMARYALGHGLDVVVEGILDTQRYGDMLRALVGGHDGPTYCYLYDISFEETLRRHATKPVAGAFGEQEMRAWWKGLQPVDGLDEKILEESLALDEAAARVVAEAWA